LNFLVPSNREIYCLADKPVASYTQLCSMEWNSLLQRDIRVIYVFFSPS